MYWPRSLVDIYLFSWMKVKFLMWKRFAFWNRQRTMIVSRVANIKFRMCWMTKFCSFFYFTAEISVLLTKKLLCNKNSNRGLAFFDVWHGMLRTRRRNSIPVLSIVMNVCLKMRKQFLLSFPHKHSFYLFSNSFLSFFCIIISLIKAHAIT